MNIAIVTGAGGNLGQAVCQKFLSEGYYVAGTITSQEKSDPSNKVDNYETVAIDLTDEDATVQFIESVASNKGRIDAAVLTVGGFAMGKVENTSTKDILKQVKLNFETAYNTARPVFLQMMKQGKGKIFLIGSRPGLDMHNSKGMIAYGLSKSLIFRLAELLNDEAKGKNVVTHVIAPSTIDT
ncbi:MAG TPA: SDR family oxidoreductase, partial [Chitinophagaceae bacterium]|nr:SDR family oxidoreductase [Chitinophagaceae bacterium]